LLTSLRAPTVAALGGTVIFCVALLILPDALRYSTLSLATSWVTFSILVYGVDLVHGSIGYLSLAHVGIWAIGAYGIFIFQLQQHLNFWESALLTIPICMVAAVIIAAFAFRTSGYYFALLTFVISELIRLGADNLRGLTGGHDGLFLFDRPALLGMSLRDPATFFRFAVLCLLAVMVFNYLIMRSPFGQKAKAVGESEDLAESLGIGSYRTKVSIFVLSSIPAAISGMLYATFSGAIQPELFGPEVGIGTVLMAILGGSGSLFGPLLGAVIYIFTPVVLPLGPVVGTGAVGLVLILVIRLSPGGLSARIADMARISFRLGGAWLGSRSASRAAR
jgi:branched-chain amino acid transport system permease protein